MKHVGKVYLLGAGPGDPELITKRAARRLAEADLVLYDALVHPDALLECRPDAERVFVGKRAGKPSERQSAIHARMLEAAAAGKTVARLKGGDPFLFGRGSEEAEFLADHGVPFEVVPGVPSPLAAVAFAGFSLTHRDLASSVAFLTATESPEKDASSHDWAKLATATPTLVIFMGVRNLRSLMQRLVEHGRPATTPAAVVRWASMPEQRTVTATVGTLADAVETAGLGMPALTIVGDVVSLRAKLRWWDTRPLFGRRVVVTRAREQAGAVAQELRDLGAVPIELPTIRIAPSPDPVGLRDAVRTARGFDAVAFTSANAVERVFEAAFDDGTDSRCLGGACILAVGAKTRDALRRFGIVADVVPREETGAAAANALLGRLTSAHPRVLFPRSRIAREDLPRILRDAGATVHEVVAYDTLPPTGEEANRIREAFAAGVDAVLLTSVSTVENLVEVLGDGAAERLRGRVVVGAIGPTTAKRARELGLVVDYVPSRASAVQLARDLETHFPQRDAS